MNFVETIKVQYRLLVLAGYSLLSLNMTLRELIMKWLEQSPIILHSTHFHILPFYQHYPYTASSNFLFPLGKMMSQFPNPTRFRFQLKYTRFQTDCGGDLVSVCPANEWRCCPSFCTGLSRPTRIKGVWRCQRRLRRTR